MDANEILEAFPAMATETLKTEEILTEQNADPSIWLFRQWSERNYAPSEEELQASSGNLRTYQQLRDRIEVENDLLVLKEEANSRIMIPDSLIEKTLEQFHNQFPMTQ